MSTIRQRGIEALIPEVLDRVWDGVDGVYVTFDTDSIDAAFAPGTTGPEPGGFTSAEIIRIGALLGSRAVGRPSSQTQ
jgi:agmatinase